MSQDKSEKTKSSVANNTPTDNTAANNSEKQQPVDNSRRQFVAMSAMAGVGLWVGGGVSAKPSRLVNDEIAFASIGVGGKGASDSTMLGNLGRMVAICDVDENNLNKKKREFTDAKAFFDYRKLLEECGDTIDAVSISTPDHMHAPISLQAMRMGKHCTCQKPMTHSIEEARMMADVAREKKLITQMGNQGTADGNLRRSAALVKAGVVGDVSEVHVWTNRPVWPQSKGYEPETGPVPKHVKWDLWLGGASKREFSHEIHPFKWRGFWDFGTGALGDMACHTLNMSFMALDMKNPISIKATTDGHDGNCFPKWSVIEYTFETAVREFKLFWYDGSKMPPKELLEDLPRDPNPRRKGKHYNSAALIVGDKGRFYSPGDYGGDRKNTGILVDGEFTPIRRIQSPKVEFPKAPTGGIYGEFAAAIKGELKAESNFPDYAGPLTEVVLLGNLAVWQPDTLIKWNAKTMQAKGATDEMNELIRHDYQNGYSIKG